MLAWDAMDIIPDSPVNLNFCDGDMDSDDNDARSDIELEGGCIEKAIGEALMIEELR